MKNYLIEQGLVINSAMFITPNGTQYPIRNISSVRIETNNKASWLIGGIVAFAFGLSQLLAHHESTFSFMSILTVICLVVWFFGRTVALVVNTSGLEKSAISYSYLDKAKRVFLNRVLGQLTLAISEMQNG